LALDEITPGNEQPSARVAAPQSAATVLHRRGEKSTLTTGFEYTVDAVHAIVGLAHQRALCPEARLHR